MARLQEDKKTPASDTVAKKTSSPKIEAAFIPGDYLSSWKLPILIVLMPLISTAIQLPLTPSHGAIPAMEYHQIMFQSSLLIYFALRMAYTGQELVSFKSQAAFIPVLAASVPVIQYYLTPLAQYVGPSYSAAIIKAVTWLPLQGLLLNVVRTSIERGLPKQEFVLGLGALGLYFGTDYLWNSWSGYLLSFAYGLARPYMMLLLSVGLMALLPKKWLALAILPQLHTLLWNPHSTLSFPTSRVNELLAPHNYTLITRTEGLTGYLSVLENIDEGFRVMRCDHSVLGGNWMRGLGSWPGGKVSTLTPGRVPEPIYAVFVMLEGVRLVQDSTPNPAPGVPDKEAKALNIGLGIGTTPTAFMAHGIDTTIVELDPTVYQLALDYFDLPKQHTAVLEDALTFVNRELNKTEVTQYDYIIHDVFTGGAEPTALFTQEFIWSLKKLLRPNGVIAINYAGELELPSTKIVLNTIMSVFPNCQLFRDVEEERGVEGHVNFVNMVVYCRKSSTPFNFREPTDEDSLGTSIRKRFLKPKLEMNLGLFVHRGPYGILAANESFVLHEGKTEPLEKLHNAAARGHWNVMRKVIPDQVWELW